MSSGDFHNMPMFSKRNMMSSQELIDDLYKSEEMLKAENSLLKARIEDLEFAFECSQDEVKRLNAGLEGASDGEIGPSKDPVPPSDNPFIDVPKGREV